MTKHRTAKSRMKAVVDKYCHEARIKPVAPGAVRVFDNLVEDLARAAEAHAKAEIKHVTKDWDHGL